VTLRLAALVSVFGAGIATGLVGCGAQRTQIIAPAATPAWLRAAATRAAAGLGDKHPRLIHFFLGRQDRIVMHGHFRCPGCSRLSDTTPIQTGTVVVITFDARTHRDTDFSIGNIPAPTAR